MRVLKLATSYLWHQKIRTSLLVACVYLVVLLPTTVEILIDGYETRLRQRAENTPLVVGAKGSRFDLLLSSLYFRGEPQELTHMGEVEALRERENVSAIPLHYAHRVRFVDDTGHEDRRIIGTEFDYFDFRGLELAAGHFPARWGEAVVGANVASRWSLQPMDKITSRVDTTFDLASTYPLRMTISGVLAPTGTSDDDVIFVDVHTSWIISGIGHGHQDVNPELDPSLILEKTDQSITTAPSMFEFNEITERNVDDFHFHSAPEQLPISAILIVPDDFRAAVQTKVHIDEASRTVQIIEPKETLTEFMTIVFQIKRFFDLNFALVLVATVLFFGVVLLLSLKVREREFRTLARVGCRRGKIATILGVEYGLIIGLGCLFAGLSAALISRFASQYF